MEKQEKQKIIYLLEGCKSFELFNKIIKSFNKQAKLYAQCWWVCKQYQYNRDKDKENKLTRIISKYNIDLDNIKEFIKTNIKHTDIDRHIANIIELDEKLNKEKEISEKIEYIGEKAINIIPIVNPSKYKDEHDNLLKCFEAYKINYNNFQLKKCKLDNPAFGYYMNVKFDNSLPNDFNQIILSSSVVDNGYFDTIKRETVSKIIKHPVEYTKDLVQEYSLEILNKLDDNGIIKIGTNVNKGDILIGCNTPDYEAVNTPEQKLLRAIFGDSSIPKKDASIINEEFSGLISNVTIEKISGGIKVDIIIDVTLGLEIGDNLGDINFNKGKIVEIITPEEMQLRYGYKYDIVSNFKLEDYILRYSPIVAESINYSVGEEYSCDNQKPKDYNNFCKPLDIDANIINKFNNFNLLDCLSEIINYSKFCSHENLPTVQIINNGVCYFKKDDIERINYLKYYFLILGIKIEVCEDCIKLNKLSKNDLLKISYGEVLSQETYNYRSLKPEPGGLFCEKIFGPEISYQCYCHKYNDFKYKGTICERCGVEILSNNARFVRCGHINLKSEFVSIFGDKIDNLIVIPPMTRPFVTSKINETINNYYKSIIGHTKRIKHFHNNIDTDILSNKLLEHEYNILQESLNNFQNYILSLIVNLIKGYVNSNKVVYAFKGVCSFDDYVSNEICLIPKDILFLLMKPYIANVLNKDKAGDAQHFYNNIDYKHENIIELFHSILKNKKLLIFSNNEKGEILNLNVDIAKGNAIILSKENYKKVCPNSNSICGILPLTDNCKQIINKNINLQKNKSELFVNNIENDVISKIFFTNEEKECNKILIRYLKDNSEI